ncbi:capsule biosynthesis GfcC family protein [Dyella sp. C9]|uniref:capsule biosynthesis GfcC family protein n=1 Tax=Dyella sp. C9 TaxID=2202154 RepID=UPI000DEF7EC8|nr:capsule biosynthesis GfcC family protein [Dyella sp. C9]
MTRRLILAMLAAWAALPCLATQVEVRGAVDAAGTRQLAARARLSDAALAAHVHLDAYFMGAAWLRPSLVVAQERQKAGLLFDLDSLQRQATKEERDDLAQLASTLSSWVKSMPATGRQVALLDPRALEVKASENWPVAEGDTLYYPRRPDTIHIVGAVARTCTVAHVALQDARSYLRDCPASRYADADWIFVVEPDGRVFRQGIAPWNRSAPLPLAPGSTIVVPISEHRVSSVAPDLNTELADFLATQPLPETTPQP